MKKCQNLITSTERTYIQGFSLTPARIHLYCMASLEKTPYGCFWESPALFCPLHIQRLPFWLQCVHHDQKPPLEAYQTKSSLVMFYEMFNDLAAIPYEYYIKPIPKSTTRYSHQHKILPLSSSKNAFKFSFFPQIIPIWINIPEELVNCNSIILSILN